MTTLPRPSGQLTEHGHDRRQFMLAAGTLAAGLAIPGLATAQSPATTPANRGRIFKSVKWGMIGAGSTVLEKFEICKELGFDGMELTTPGLHDAKEVRSASEATEMPVHGTVGQKHWQVRLSDPDPAVREQAREDLIVGLKETQSYGGNTILLVPGAVRGDQETHDDVWNRSIEQILLVLPTASKLGVRVLIENVWNGFCETPEQLRDYLDEINSPWVGAYFDIGNVRKFSPSENWVRVLGNRIVKLDVKDWGKQNGFCKIGDGDVNWPAVCEALEEIGYTGWCTAEVGGGGRERLAEIAERMNKVLML
ncbi:sugar phosphate isomerase/epimerase family protein [Aeoliella mucimassa]|uniref:L-ribulose-5-phosphate 3-epimerase UlaE n=1 Tax=Aeoliella mucimassa TaxID=2527972 RepID=A0A518ALJ2_9BACT|nr:sugar phosphate isomerase/epimerase family protein [Aeoliella mucimassa]QDU55605.1 L-ribulose-5-phosphate 3-epimerase UlaE [Aeoliella mucimassa]